MMPKPLRYRPVGDLTVTDDAAHVVAGFLVPYGAGEFASGAFARSLTERGHKVAVTEQRDARNRVEFGRPLVLEERREGLWAEFAIPAADTAVRVAYRPLRMVGAVCTEAALSHIAVGVDPSRDRQARLDNLQSILRASAPDRAPRSVQCPP